MANLLQPKIEAAVDANTGKIQKCLSELVQIPSVTGQETEAQKYVEKMYSDIGLKVETFVPDINKLKKHPAYVDPAASDDKYLNRPVVEGIWEGKNGGKSIKLNAHIDTVPVGNENDWLHSPWSGVVIDGKLYGRGAYDNKHGIIANYFALKSLLDAGLRPAGKVILESAVEEEGGGAGTLAGLLEGYITDGLIVTDGGGINIACGGINYCKVTVRGKSAHAGHAERGINAILKMNKIVQAIVDLDDKRSREIQYPLITQFGEKRASNHVVTIYNAGHYRAAVPEWAEIECRLGNIPGETSGQVRKEFEDAVMQAARADEWLRENPPRVEWKRVANEAWEQDPNHPLVQIYKSCAESIFQRDIALSGFSASCDIRFAQYFNIPGLVTGALGENAHSPNECVDLPTLLGLTKTLALFITKWCGITGY